MEKAKWMYPNAKPAIYQIRGPMGTTYVLIVLWLTYASVATSVPMAELVRGVPYVLRIGTQMMVGRHVFLVRPQTSGELLFLFHP